MESAVAKRENFVGIATHFRKGVKPFGAGE